MRTCLKKNYKLITVHKLVAAEKTQSDLSYWQYYNSLESSLFFIFFSVRERAEFSKSRNLIGFRSGRNFPIRPALGRRNHERCLRADVWNYGESGVSREISNFFIFCPSDLYSEVFSKITLKVSTAFHFFRNRAKFENKVCWLLPMIKLAENNTF